MRELTINEAENVDGGFWVQVVLAVIGGVAGALASEGMSGDGPSATLSNGTTIQCGEGQNLEVSGNSAKCS